MKRAASIGRILWKALNPPTPIAVLAAPIIAGLMAWVFLLGNESSPLAYAAYVLSAYLLTVLCIAIVRKRPVAQARSLVSRSERGARMMEDASYRRRASMSAGLAIDAVWATANLGIGIFEASVWPITLGVYYLLLSTMRGLVVSHMRESQSVPLKRARRISRACGIMTIASTLALSGMVTLVMRGEGGFSYDGFLIYAAAAFAFYSLASSIAQRIRARKAKDLLVLTSARINLSVALVSMFALEIAMFAAFGSDGDAELQFVLPIITGAAIALANIAMGVRSIRSANQPLSL